MHFVVYGSWDHESPVPADVQASIAEGFKPHDDLLCLWVEPTDSHVVNVSFDVEAQDFDEAIDIGRAALQEAADLGPLAGRATRVVSMTEEGQSIWSADA